MDFFLYLTAAEDRQKRLEILIKTAFPKKKIQVFRSFNDFSQRIRKPVQENSVAVLAPANRRELEEILSRRDVLRGLRIIVAAPDHELETIALAHQLRPRFLTYLNGDFGELAAVLGKMITDDHPEGKSRTPSLSTG